MDKNGFHGLHKFIDELLLISAYKAQYKDIKFYVPTQEEVDEFISRAKEVVSRREYLQILKALAPPRGRPCTDASVLLRK